MSDGVLLMLILLATLALMVFAAALCTTAARADELSSGERPESRHAGERAERSGLSIAASLTSADDGAPPVGQRRAAKAPVFLVDEQGEGEESIEIRITAKRVRAEVKRRRDSRPACARRARDGGRLRARYRHGRYRQLSDRTRSLGLWGAAGGRRGPRRQDR